MNDHQNTAAEHTGGIQKKSAETTSFENVEEARQFYQVARKRLLDVNNWQHIAGSLGSNFILRDVHGQSIAHRFPEVGDYIQIDIPGPGSKAGDGHDWVRIEGMDDIPAPDADEMTSLRARPAANPMGDPAEAAHILDDHATSTFVVFRIGNHVTAEVFGHGEAANTDTQGLLDKVRNVAITIGSWFGFSDAQWTSLTKAIVEN